MANGSFLTTSTTLFELTKKAILAIVVLAILASLIGLPLPVQGQSMEPNFHTGQLVLVEHLSYFGTKAIQHGDVVAAKFPADPKHTRLIKRVLGLPGDTLNIKDGQVSLNGQPLSEIYQPIYGAPPYTEIASITLKEGEYFLMGDNRPGSSDSRLWGPVNKSDILGRVSFVLWPIGQISYVNRVGG